MRKISILLVLVLSVCFCGCNGGTKMKSEKIVNENNKKLLDEWVLSNKLIKECKPAWTFNYERAKEKGLSDDGKTFNDKYFYIQAAYKFVLSKYLRDNMGLGEYDEQISKCELKFIEAKDDKKTIFQKNNPSGMKFIFIRSNIYVENLSKEDIKTIEDALLNSDDITKDILGIVKDTYKDVLSCVREDEGNKEHEIIYEDGALYHGKALNTALVIGIADAYEWDDKGSLVNTQNERLKEEYIKKLAEEITKEYIDKLQMPVKIFIYK